MPARSGGEGTGGSRTPQPALSWPGAIASWMAGKSPTCGQGCRVRWWLTEGSLSEPAGRGTAWVGL